MANRDFKDFQAAEREVKRLYMKATIGATGAPTLVAADSLGIKTIVRNTTGDYTVTFGTPSPLETLPAIQTSTISFFGLMESFLMSMARISAFRLILTTQLAPEQF